MIKLKKLLKESYAWQRRNENGSLPTLEEVQAEYNRSKTNEDYKDNKNYQPSIEVVNRKRDGNGYPIITVKIDGGKPFDIEFDDHDEVDDHGYTKAIWLMGVDEGGGEWGMEGSMALHGEIEDYDIDTLEKEVTGPRSMFRENEEDDLHRVDIDNIKNTSIKFEDIDPKQYPKFTDAFISYAEFENGDPLNDDQMEWLMMNEHDWVYQRLQDYLY